jgi:hypothetical protein
LFSVVKTMSLDGRLLLSKMAASGRVAGRGVLDAFIRHHEKVLISATPVQ